MSYSEKLKDPRWQKKRLLVMQRDGFRCRDCKSSTETLNVHHCYYERGGPWETPDDLLLTLCETCHEDRQIAEEQIKKHICEKMAKQPLNLLIEFANSVQNGGTFFVVSGDRYADLLKKEGSRV